MEWSFKIYEEAPCSNDTRRMIIFTVGAPPLLTNAEARRAAKEFVRIMRGNPNALVTINMMGFDGDPCELPEIPEAMRLMAEWAQDVRKRDGTVLDRLPELDRALIDVAEGRARFVSHGLGHGGKIVPT